MPNRLPSADVVVRTYDAFVSESLDWRTAVDATDARVNKAGGVVAALIVADIEDLFWARWLFILNVEFEGIRLKKTPELKEHSFIKSIFSEYALRINSKISQHVYT